MSIIYSINHWSYGQSNKGITQFNVPLANLSTGVYVYRITINDQSFNKKIIKTN